MSHHHYHYQNQPCCSVKTIIFCFYLFFNYLIKYIHIDPVSGKILAQFLFENNQLNFSGDSPIERLNTEESPMSGYPQGRNNLLI